MQLKIHCLHYLNDKSVKIRKKQTHIRFFVKLHKVIDKGKGFSRSD